MATPHTLRESLRFFVRWLGNPYLIGAVAPSSRGLANGMARPVDMDAPGGVVELGGGTGKMTQALLDRGLPSDRLMVVEKDPEMHRKLADRFPSLRVVNGDAAELGDLVRSEGFGEVKAVVSGLPLIGMPQPIRKAIVGQSFEAMGPDGIFVQFTYTLVSPVPPDMLTELGLEGRWVERVWWNLPPARVWVYRRRGLDG